MLFDISALLAQSLIAQQGIRFSGARSNISGEKTSIRLGGGTDEWFHPQGESTIEACYYRRVKNEKAEETIQIPCNRSPIGIGYELKDVSLDANEIIEQQMSYTMFLSDHCAETLVYRYLVDRPLVKVEFPKTLHVTVSFHHRDNFEDETQSGHISKRLERILLPYQDIQIIWHRRDEVEQRIKRHSLSS